MSFNTCGASLPAGSSCRIYVAFAATRLGAQSATISVIDGYSGTYTLAITATGALSTQFEIVNGLTAKALSAADVYDGSTIQQMRLTGSANQIWRAVLISNGYYRIENAATGKVLDATGASQANGTTIQQYAWLGTDNQQWQFLSVNNAHFRISIIIDKNGIPKNISVVDSLGFGLDENAADCVTHWRFSPATNGGKPVEAPAKVQVNFHLLKQPE